MKTKFNKILLKISGEALMGTKKYGLDPEMLSYVAEQICSVQKFGVQLSIVVGGGNIFRGIHSDSLGIKRISADHIGMLATVINSLALRDVLEKFGLSVRVLTSVVISGVAEHYVLRRALNHLNKNRIVIFAAGLGNPYFSTDTAAVLRAVELNFDILLKATKVDGLYDADPEIYKDAKFIKSIKHMEVITRRFGIMDNTSISLAMNNFLPINIFNINKSGSIEKIICGDKVGTIII